MPIESITCFIDLNDIRRERMGRDCGAVEIYIGPAALFVPVGASSEWLPADDLPDVDGWLEDTRGWLESGEPPAVLARWTLPGYADASEWSYLGDGIDADVRGYLSQESGYDDGAAVDRRGWDRQMQHVIDAFDRMGLTMPADRLTLED